MLLLAVIPFTTFTDAVTVPVGASHPDLSLKWQAYIGPDAATTIQPLAGDLNGDGNMEIVLTSGPADLKPEGSVTALSGEDGKILWQVSSKNLTSIGGNIGIDTHSPAELVDLNKDGKQEIVIPTWNGVLALWGNGTVIWRTSPTTMSSNNYMAIADVNGDGYPEIFVSGGNGPSNGYDYITALNSKGQVLYQGYSWHPCFGGLTIGDPENNGHFIVFQGDRSYGYYDEGDPYIGGGLGMHAYDANTLQLLWSNPNILSSSDAPVLADVTGSGHLDVVIADLNGGIAVLNADDGTVDTTGGIYRWAYTYGGTNGTAMMRAHSTPTVFQNPSGNGHLDLVDCNNTQPIIWDLTSWQADGYLPNVIAHEPPKVGYITADGKPSLIVMNQSAGFPLMVFQYNPSVPGKYQLVDQYPGTGEVPLAGPNDFTLVQDVDGDGYNELVVSTATGWVYTFDTLGKASTPLPRSEVQFYSERKDGVSTYVPPFIPTAPVITNESPKDTSTNQTANPTLQVNAASFQNKPLTVTFQTNTNGAWTTVKTWSNAANGVYSYPTSNMNSPGKTYSWKVLVSDGSKSSSATFSFTTTTSPPTHGRPIITAETNGNIVCSSNGTAESNGLAVRNIFSWLNNGIPVTALNMPFDIQTSSNPLASTTLASEGFENNFAQWTNTGWDISTQSHAGSSSAHAGSSSQTLELNSLQTSSAESITVSFYYKQVNIDGAMNLQFWNGTAYRTIASFDKTAPSETWQYYSIQTLDKEYLTEGFKIRFSNGMYSGNFYIDDFSVTIPTQTRDYAINNSGTVHGATWINNGVNGGAYLFNGVSDFIRVADNPNLAGTGNANQLSVEFWINPSSYQSGSTILTKRDPTNDKNQSSYMVAFAPGTTRNILTWGVNTNAGWREARLTYSLNPGTWYHIVCTYQTGTGLKIYVNGALSTSASGSGNILSSQGTYRYGAPLFIGCDYSMSYGTYFNGDLDELRIYTRALSPAQISQSYSESKSSQSDSAVIVKQETSSGDSWICRVTPTNSYVDGQTKTISQDKYSVTATANPSGGGSVSGPSTGKIYYFDDSVTLVASANDGYKFTGWADGATGLTRTVSVNGNMTIQANFALIQPPTSTNNGSPTTSPNKTTQPGTTTTPTPKPNETSTPTPKITVPATDNTGEILSLEVITYIVASVSLLLVAALAAFFILRKK